MLRPPPLRVCSRRLADVRATLPEGQDVLAFQCRNPIHRCARACTRAAPSRHSLGATAKPTTARVVFSPRPLAHAFSPPRAHYELFIRALDAPNVRDGAVCLVHPTCGPTQVRARQSSVGGMATCWRWPCVWGAVGWLARRRTGSPTPRAHTLPPLRPAQDDDIPGIVRYHTYEVLKEEVANPRLRWVLAPGATGASAGSACSGGAAKGGGWVGGGEQLRQWGGGASPCLCPHRRLPAARANPPPPPPTHAHTTTIVPAPLQVGLPALLDAHGWPARGNPAHDHSQELWLHSLYHWPRHGGLQVLTDGRGLLR